MKYCSFCGKSKDEVLILIAGPSVFICDGCTDICTGLVRVSRGDEKLKKEEMQDLIKRIEVIEAKLEKGI